MKFAGMALLLMGFSGVVLAGVLPSVPEISPATGVGAIALLSGALLVIRARRKK
jgi:LPXTG-motif cell wall-anchored protein